MKKIIGGYFELELLKGREFHPDAIRLNTGRNAFEYILRAKNYKKVYLPYYTCDVMLEPILKLALKHEFYSIDKTFRPLFDFKKIKSDEVFVYNNYFGICDSQVKEVASICSNIIIDNSQAFYSKPLPGVDTLYSPRKFFGLPDGAYLYTASKLGIDIEQSVSYQRMEHLLGRLDIGAEEFYRSFKENSTALCGLPIQKMSNLTLSLLKSIDYSSVARKRRANYLFIDNHIKNRNQIQINFEENTVPMVYPYLVENGKALKRKLIENKIFIPTFWPNVIKWADENSWEFHLSSELVLLPVDQRYDPSLLGSIVRLIQHS